MEASSTWETPLEASLYDVEIFFHLGKKGKTGLKLQPTNHPFRNEKIIWPKPPWFCSIFRGCKTAAFLEASTAVSQPKKFSQPKNLEAEVSAHHWSAAVHCSPWPFETLKLTAKAPENGWLEYPLTYPTLGKGKSFSKCHFWGIC